MISVSARPNVNQESDTAAKQMSPTCVCRNSFLHGPLHGPPHLGVTHESLFTGLPVAQPPFPSPSFLAAQPAPSSHVRGPLPHPNTPAITNSSLPTKSCRKLWPGRQMLHVLATSFFQPPSPHSLLHIPTELEILPFSEDIPASPFPRRLPPPSTVF